MTTLTQGSPGQAIDTTSATVSDLPQWYQDYTSNLANQASNIAQANNAQGVPQQSVAGFNSTQQQAFQNVQNNQGNYQPTLNAATADNSQIAPTATGLVSNAQSAVAGPAQTWNTDTANSYMSPYTSQVVDNLSNAADMNWNDNIMPSINNSMIGNGEFGSTRNADALTQGAAQFQTGLDSSISQALQSGYTGAQQQFNADAGRQQQQGALQASTALTGASTDANALNAAATGAGALSQTTQQLGNTDTQSLLNVGNQQQQQQQTGLNTDYSNLQAQQQAPWTQLGNMSSVVNNIKLPTSTTTDVSAPANSYGPSALGGALSTYMLSQGLNPTTGSAYPYPYAAPQQTTSGTQG